MPLTLFAHDSSDALPSETHRIGESICLGGEPVGDTLYRHAFDMRGVSHYFSTIPEIDLSALLSIPHVWSALSNVTPTDIVYKNIYSAESLVIPCTVFSNNDDDKYPSYSLDASDFDISKLLTFINKRSDKDIDLTMRIINRQSGVSSDSVSVTFTRPQATFTINVFDGMSIRRTPTKADLYRLVSVDSPGFEITDIELLPSIITDTECKLVLDIATRISKGSSPDAYIYTTHRVETNAFIPGTFIPDITDTIIRDVSIDGDCLSITVTGNFQQDEDRGELNTIYHGLSFGTDLVDITVPSVLAFDASLQQVTSTSKFPIPQITSLTANAYISPSHIHLIQRSSVLGESSMATRVYIGSDMVRMTSGMVPTIINFDSDTPHLYGSKITDSSSGNTYLQLDRPNSGLGYIPRFVASVPTGIPVDATLSNHILTAGGIVGYGHHLFGVTRLIYLNVAIPGTQLVAYAATETNANAQQVHAVVSTNNEFYIASTTTVTQNTVTYKKIKTDAALTNMKGYSSGVTLQMSATATVDTPLPTFWSYNLSSSVPVLEYKTSISSVYRMIIMHVMRYTAERYQVLGYVRSPRGSLEMHIVEVWYTTKWNVIQKFAKEIHADNTVSVAYGKLIHVPSLCACITVGGITYLWYPDNGEVLKLDNFIATSSTYQNGQIIISGSRDGFGCIVSDLCDELEPTTKNDAEDMAFFLVSTL